ncbi:M12 family metallo-peptidase [Desulfovibrio sp. TomC]|uniref:M12 family metallo-peptidase n=1 Tax=Desulfovibrio sp. TomC TaxID=1562888 RepID=UPI000574481F|nr:M12 family metallo-peptidase [Desulfovibrio sp. TomC]KHK03072.1 hypothetical protein NY78_1601 [Desulfovibrio sp. TomC]
MDLIRAGILLVAVLFLFPAAPVRAGATPGIFTAAPAASETQSKAVPAPGKTLPALRSRTVLVDQAALFPAAADGRKAAVPDAALTLNLFDDVTIAMTPRESERAGTAGTTVLVGDNDAASGGQTRFANTAGTLYGIVRTSGNLLYEITPTGSGEGTYVIREIDQGSYPDEEEKLPPDAGPAASDAAGASGGAAVAGDDGSIIDVMVLYTPSARAAAGGEAAMQARIALAFSETNQGYAQSGVIQRFRLVHAQEVAYVEDTGSSGFDIALGNLQNPSDGVIDNIHALRNQYGADIVSLLINNGWYCGLGYLMTSTSSNFAANAFNVVDYSCATGYYSFAHECGHNQGAHHDRANAGGSILYSYAYGFQQTAASPAFRTIMAYNCSPSCTRVNYWSNPEVSYKGYPTGVLYTAGNAADNRRTLNNTRTIAANWRQAIRQAVGVVPPTSLLLQGQ